MESERRWPWWAQVRDVAASVAGFTVLSVETYRGTYNPIAMGFAAACIGILASGVFGRWLLGRWNGNGAQK